MSALRVNWVWGWGLLRAVGVAGIALGAGLAIRWAPPVAAQAGCDFARADVRFYAATDDCRGFTIENAGALRLLDVYLNEGGAARLGRVASQPFTVPTLPGYWLQATDRFVISIKDSPTADPKRDGSLANLLDLTSAGGETRWDAVLLAKYGIPPALSWPKDVGLSSDDRARHHFEAVFGDSSVSSELRPVADALRGYLTGQGSYALFGLPTSRIERSVIGQVPRYCVRLQRGGLCWRDELGGVVPEYAGADLLRTVGLLTPAPAGAFDPQPPPGIVRAEIQPVAQPVRLYEPLPGPLALLCDRVPGVPPCGPAVFTPLVRLQAEGLGGRVEPDRLAGLFLTVNARDLATNVRPYNEQRIDLGADPVVPLPPLGPEKDATYDIGVRLAGKYRDVSIPPDETSAQIRIVWIAYERWLGLPAVLVRGALGLAALIAAAGMAGQIRRFGRTRRALPLPAYPIVVNGLRRSLADYGDYQVAWTRWLLGRVFIAGRAVGASGLRFGMDLAGNRYVAGKGRLLTNGRALARLAGTPVAEGDVITFDAAQQVVIGARAGTAPRVPPIGRPAAARPGGSGIAAPCRPTAGSRLDATPRPARRVPGKGGYL